MAVGKPGGLAVTPPPKEPEKGDALDLLTVLGDPKRVKEARKYLEDVRGVLAENERVSEEAARLIAEADRKTADLVEATAAHAKKVRVDTEALDARQLEVSGREGRAGRKEQENTQVSAQLVDRETSVGDRERRLERQAVKTLEEIQG